MDPNCISNPGSPLYQSNYAAQQMMLQQAASTQEQSVRHGPPGRSEWAACGVALAAVVLLCWLLRE